MRKKLLVVLSPLMLILLLTACGCEHEWQEASCSAPKTCSACGETEGETLPHTWLDATCSAAKTCSVCNTTEGEALPHTWLDATCTVPKTCSVCSATEGEPLGHTWQDATCTTVKTCTVCQVTEGEPLGHTWQDATCTVPKTCSVCSTTEGQTAAHTWQEATTEAPKTCSVCKKTEGSKLQTDSRFTTKSTKQLQGTWVSNVLFTDEMMGLTNFGNAQCVMILTFGNTGSFSMSVKIRDENDFLKKLKAYTVEDMYTTFAQQGMSRAEADQAMLSTYGLNVNDYVDAVLDGYDVNEALSAYNSKGVYYVEGDKLCTALSWNAIFEKDKFTLENGKLKIEDLSLEEGGEPLIWQRQ